MSHGEEKTVEAESSLSSDAATLPSVAENLGETGNSDKRFQIFSQRGLVLIGISVVLLIVTILVIVFLSPINKRVEPDPVAVTVPVALSDVAVPSKTKIGIVLTLGSGVTEGSEWNQAAQGAVVAQHRLALGGADIELLVENDFGSGAGSEGAVRNLIEQGVSGIVYASAGIHIGPGLAVAEKTGVPVILPYATVPKDLSGVWSLVPDEQSMTSALKNLLARFHRPLHVNAGDGLVSAVTVSDQIEFHSETDALQFAADVARRTGKDPFAGGGR